jgi:hypothetical protein
METFSKGFLVWAFLLAIVASVVAMVFGMFLPAIATMPYGQIITLVLALILAVALAAKGDIDKLNIFQFVVLLGLIGVFGSILTTIYPPAAGFIVSVGNFTVTGLLWTFVYLLIGEMGLQAGGIRE